MTWPIWRPGPILHPSIAHSTLSATEPAWLCGVFIFNLYVIKFCIFLAFKSKRYMSLIVKNGMKPPSCFPELCLSSFSSVSLFPYFLTYFYYYFLILKKKKFETLSVGFLLCKRRISLVCHSTHPCTRTCTHGHSIRKPTQTAHTQTLHTPPTLPSPPHPPSSPPSISHYGLNNNLGSY